MTDEEHKPPKRARAKALVPVKEIIASMERVALDPAMDPERLEKFLNMQERIIDRQEEREYNAAMVGCQAAIPKVSKDKPGEKPNTRFASLENVIDVAGPVWAEFGFALEFYEGDGPEGMVRVCCDVRHIGGHVEHRKIDVPLDDLGPQGNPNKTKTQGTGSSFSYGKRYLSCGIFNIATGDDRNGASPVAETLMIDEEQCAELDKLLGQLPERPQQQLWDWLNSKKIETFGQITLADFDNIKAQLVKTIAAYLASKQ